MNKNYLSGLILVSVAACNTPAGKQPAASPDSAGYAFEGGYPTEETIRRAYDDADLARAIQAYKFFYPTVSGIAMFIGNKKVGVVPNKVFGKLDTKPVHVGYTLNSDTPYGPAELDLSNGPMVVDIPPGPLIVVAMDVNQRWLADMGIPGPDQGKGGKHLILPPGYAGEVPKGYYACKSLSNRVLVGLRSLPVNGDAAAAMDRIGTVKFYPLQTVAGWQEPTWPDLTPQPQNSTPHEWETDLRYWEELHKAIDMDPAVPDFKYAYGDLAVLGIAKGKPFSPDDRMKSILKKAAVLANGQMRVQSLADRRADRVVWPDRKWEWASLRFENADFATPNYVDMDAREKWFYQAIATSPAMFRRQAGFGSLYWLGLRDASGDYLDGGKTYKLTMPDPVPAGLFWSVTVYDADTRSQVQTEQGKAALRSLFELKDLPAGSPAELYFGPKAPAGKENQWIQTLPGKGWFTYIRIYGPQAAAFDGSWKPGDFEKID